MKKGKKMPSIELDGHSEAKFALIDGKIVRMENQRGQAHVQPPAAMAGAPSFDLRLRD